MRIYLHGNDKTSGYGLLGTLIELLGILIIITSGISALLSITRNGEKILEKAEQTIESQNTVCTKKLSS